MLRTKKKQLNLKPNRVLDKRSSRGMLFENEELRIRTIHINDEVERGQHEVKKLRKENEYLKREIWSLRDECEKLEEVLKKIYSGQMPDISELPTYQPTRKHSTASTAFGMWSSRRMSGISNFSSYGGEYEEEEEEQEGQTDNKDRHKDRDRDGQREGQREEEAEVEVEEEDPSSYNEQSDQQQQNQSYYQDEEQIVQVQVHQDESYADDPPSPRHVHKISVDSTNSYSCDSEADPGDDRLDKPEEMDNNNANSNTVRYYTQHNPWQLHSPELSSVTEESEVNSNSNNTSITLSHHTDPGYDPGQEVERVGNQPLSGGEKDQDKSNTISPFFNPTIEITPASSTNSINPLPLNPNNNNNNVENKGNSQSNSISVNRKESCVDNDNKNSNSNLCDSVGVQDLGLVTLIPKKYQVTSEIKINPGSASSEPGFEQHGKQTEQSECESAGGQLHSQAIYSSGMSLEPGRAKDEDASSHSLLTQPQNNNCNCNSALSSLDSIPSSSSNSFNLHPHHKNCVNSPPFDPGSHSRLEEKRRNFHKNASHQQYQNQSQHQSCSSEGGGGLGWSHNQLVGQNSPDNNSIRKKSLPLYQSEPSLTSIDVHGHGHDLGPPGERSSDGGLRSSSQACNRSQSLLLGSLSGERVAGLGFDGFDHTVEMCSGHQVGGEQGGGPRHLGQRIGHPLPLHQHQHLHGHGQEGSEDENEAEVMAMDNQVGSGWNSVDRNVVIGYLDDDQEEDDQGPEGSQRGGGIEVGFSDLSAQEVIDELESQFDPTLERVAGVRMLVSGIGGGNSSGSLFHGPKRVFISLRTAVGVKTFIDKGFCLRNRPLRLIDASKKFSLILLAGIPPAVPDSAVISMLNEYGQVVAPLERRVYKGVDISERLARMHLVRKIPPSGVTLPIAGYQVLAKVLQTNVSPGVLSSNSLSRPHSSLGQYVHQTHPLQGSPLKSQEMMTGNEVNCLSPPCDLHPVSSSPCPSPGPNPHRYHSPLVQRRQSQIPGVVPPSSPFLDSQRNSIGQPSPGHSPGHGPTATSPNYSTNSKIPAIPRKLGKSLSAAPGYLAGNPVDNHQEGVNPHPPPAPPLPLLHSSSMGPTAMAISKRKMSVCSMDPLTLPVEMTPKSPTSPGTVGKAFLGNPKKPLSRLPRSSPGSLVPQSSSGSGPHPDSIDGQQHHQQHQQSGGGFGKSFLRSLSFEPRRFSSNSMSAQNNNVNMHNNNSKIVGSQTSLAESSHHGNVAPRGSILTQSSPTSKYYQPHGQLTNSTQLRRLDKKSSVNSLPWFGCC